MVYGYDNLIEVILDLELGNFKIQSNYILKGLTMAIEYRKSSHVDVAEEVKADWPAELLGLHFQKWRQERLNNLAFL